MVARVPFNVSIKMPVDADYAGVSSIFPPLPLVVALVVTICSIGMIPASYQCTNTTSLPPPTVFLITTISHLQGQAYELLSKMHNDPEFNKTHALFWSTQPIPEDVFAPETYSDLHINELQSEFSKSHTEAMKSVAIEYYNGTYGEDAKFSKPINEVIAPHSVDVGTFLYVSALIVTREFEFEVEGEDCVYLFPCIDMFNDCLKGDCNVERTNNDEFVKILALKDIKKGEQLTMMYQSEVTHRPDMSLLVYGFTMPSDPPLMAAQDLPDFESSNPFKETGYTDDEYRPKSRDALVKEIARCRAILDGFATTAEEDEALLKSGKWDGAGEWKMQEVIKSRLARKRGLLYHIKEMMDTLAEL